MEESIILLLILFLIFGTGSGQIIFPDTNEKDVIIEEDKVTGNEDISEKK